MNLLKNISDNTLKLVNELENTLKNIDKSIIATKKKWTGKNYQTDSRSLV